MNDTLREVTRWADRGDRIAIAMVVGAMRSAPRPLGTKMAINDRGEISGSVSPWLRAACVVVDGSPSASSSDASDCSAPASCPTCLLDSQHRVRSDRGRELHPHGTAALSILRGSRGSPPRSTKAAGWSSATPTACHRRRLSDDAIAASTSTGPGTRHSARHRGRGAGQAPTSTSTNGSDRLSARGDSGANGRGGTVSVGPASRPRRNRNRKRSRRVGSKVERPPRTATDGCAPEPTRTAGARAAIDEQVWERTMNRLRRIILLLSARPGGGSRPHGHRRPQTARRSHRSADRRSPPLLASPQATGSSTPAGRLVRDRASRRPLMLRPDFPPSGLNQRPKADWVGPAGPAIAISGAVCRSRLSEES